MQKVVAAIGPAPDELFIEIGPGRGALTLPLAQRARRLLAIELDTALVGELRSVVPPGVDVLQADFLRVDLIDTAAALRRAIDPPTALLRVAGNLPYAASAPILLRLLRNAATARIHDAVVMLQREVAERVVAEPGSRAYGPLAVMAALHAEARWRLDVPPGAFRPMPRVQSAVVSLRFRDPVRAPVDPAVFESLIRTLFTRRRKQVVNALAACVAARRLNPLTVCRAAGLSPTRRPGTLDLPELIELADVLATSEH